MVDFQSFSRGSKLKAIGGVVVLLLFVIAAAYVTGLLGAPSVAGVENRFGDVTDTTTTIETDLVVNNPNPIGIQLGGMSVNYTVNMNGIAMANGTKEGLSLQRGNSTLRFSTQMQNEEIPVWWVSHIGNDERTRLEIDARVRSSLLGRTASVPYSQDIDTDIISQFNSSDTRPVNANQPVVSDPILYINRTSGAWGSVSQSKTPIEMEFVVYNPKPVPYTITEIGYDITMNNVSVGEGRTEEPHVIPGGAERTIEATTAIENPTLDKWWVSHLRRNQVTDLRIEFYARVELPTGNTVRVPLDELTYTQRIETDFFGTKNTSAPPTSAQSTSTPAEDGTKITERETSSVVNETELPAETATPTATPTPAETPPEDGGLLYRRPAMRG